MISRGTLDLTTWLRRNVVDEDEADILAAANGFTPDAVRQVLVYLERCKTLIHRGSRWRAAAVALTEPETPPVDPFEEKLTAELQSCTAHLSSLDRSNTAAFTDAHTQERTLRWCLSLYQSLVPLESPMSEPIPFADAIEKIAALHTEDEPLSTQRAANALGVALDVRTIIGARTELQLHALMRRSGFVPTAFPIEPSTLWRPVWPIVILDDRDADDGREVWPIVILDDRDADDGREGAEGPMLFEEWQECPEVPTIIKLIASVTEVTFAEVSEHTSRSVTFYEVDAMMDAIGWERALLPCGPARIAGWRKREVAPRPDDDGGTLGDASGDASGV